MGEEHGNDHSKADNRGGSIGKIGDQDGGNRR